jgi:hypothetical protein
MEMIINLSPTAGQTKTTIEVVDENTLKYDGVVVDFSAIPNGGEVEATEPAIGTIAKDLNGVITIGLQRTYDSKDCSYDERFPANPYVVSGGILNV